MWQYYGTMNILLVPRENKIIKRLEHENYTVESTDLGQLSSNIQGASVVVIAADRLQVKERAYVLSHLKSFPSALYVFASDTLTTKVATSVSTAGALVTTVAAVSDTLDSIERFLRERTELTLPPLVGSSGPPQNPPRSGRSESPTTFEGYVVPKFHVGPKGFIDAGRVAKAFGLSLSALARALDVTPSALTKRKTASAAQAGLRKLEFVWAVLRKELASEAKVRAWLNASHPELDNEPPRALLSQGSIAALADFVESGLAGQPT
jgi:hypothetical protein